MDSLPLYPIFNMCVYNMKFNKRPDTVYDGSKFHNGSLLQADVTCHYNSTQVNVILKGIPNSILTTRKLITINCFLNFTYVELQPKVRNTYINKTQFE